MLALGVLCQFALAGLCELGELALTALGQLGESRSRSQLRQFAFASSPPARRARVLGRSASSDELAGALGQLCELAISALGERCELALALGLLCQFALAGLGELGELAFSALGQLDELALALGQLSVSFA